MLAYRLTLLATVAMSLTYVWTTMMVGRARGVHKVQAPATTGPDAFNRVFRANVNTLEQLVAMLPVMWVFAVVVSDVWAAASGLLWIVGRIVYVTAYASAAEKRGPGFGITFTAWSIAAFGSLIAIGMSFVR